MLLSACLTGGPFMLRFFSCYIALCTCRTKRKLVLVTLIMNDQNLDLPEVNCSYYEVQEYRDTVNKLNDLVVSTITSDHSTVILTNFLYY